MLYVTPDHEETALVPVASSPLMSPSPPPPQTTSLPGQAATVSTEHSALGASHQARSMCIIQMTVMEYTPASRYVGVDQEPTSLQLHHP